MLRHRYDRSNDETCVDLKVLHVFKTYWPDTFGGVERVISEICDNTFGHGVSCDVVTVSPDKPTGGVFLPFRQHRYASYKRDLNLASTDMSLAFFVNLRRLARSYDILHYHSPWPFGDLVEVMTFPGKPYVVTYHSDIVRQKLLGRIIKPLSNRFLSRAARIVATSENYRRTSNVLHGYVTDVIPIGLSEDGYPTPEVTDRVRWAIGDGSPYVLSIGVNRHYKGLETLLSIATELEARVVIASAGPRAASLEAQLNANNPAGAIILRDVTEGEKVALLEGCSIFAFPSRNRAEAYGLGLVEAAMVGRPMVSTEVGSGTSFVNRHGDTGLVVQGDDPVAFCEAVNMLIRDTTTRSRMGRAARQRYLEQLSGSLMGARYARLYREILPELLPENRTVT